MEFSLYVHIPFCRQKCDYCDFFSIPLKSGLPLPSKEGYVSAVLNEIRFYAARYSVLRWKTVYIGGGTPSQLGDELLCRLISGIKAAVPDKKIDEFTVEVNPEDVTESLLSSLEKAGADRISVGKNQQTLSCANSLRCTESSEGKLAQKAFRGFYCRASRSVKKFL